MIKAWSESGLVFVRVPKAVLEGMTREDLSSIALEFLEHRMGVIIEPITDAMAVLCGNEFWWPIGELVDIDEVEIPLISGGVCDEGME